MTMNWKTLAYTLADFDNKPNLTFGDPTSARPDRP